MGNQALKESNHHHHISNTSADSNRSSNITSQSLLYPEKYRGLKLLKFISRNVVSETIIVKRILNSKVRSPRLSLKPVYSPPVEEGYEHPNNWLWHHEEWDCYVDENGNVYYYNALTGESSWDPPSVLLQQYDFPQYLSANTTATANATTPTLNATVDDIIEPNVAITNMSTNPNVIIEHNTLAEIADEGNNTTDEIIQIRPNENDELIVNDSLLADNASTRITSATQSDTNQNTSNTSTTLIIPPPTPVVIINKEDVWESFSIFIMNNDIDQSDNHNTDDDNNNNENNDDNQSTKTYQTLLDRYKESSTILEQVSLGNYQHSLLVMLSWAYKFHQFEEALIDCFTKNGDYRDSSRYDNCDGLPKFTQNGFLEWFNFTENSYQISTAHLLQNNSDEEEEERAKKQMAALEFAITKGTDTELLNVMNTRIDDLHKEMEIMQSRCLAIVSIQSGPSKEALDNIYYYIKDAIERNVDLMDIQDEMEEFVQNQIELRHKFLVDIILQNVLDDLELEALQTRVLLLTALFSPSSDTQADEEILTHSKQEQFNSNSNIFSDGINDDDGVSMNKYKDDNMNNISMGSPIDVQAFEDIMSAKEKELSDLKEIKLMEIKATTSFHTSHITENAGEGMGEEETQLFVDNMESEHRVLLAQYKAQTLSTLIEQQLEQQQQQAVVDEASSSTVAVEYEGESLQSINQNNNNETSIQRNTEILAYIRAQADMQQEALASDLEARHVKQLKQLHERLDKLKELRAQELVATEGTSVYEAVELANKEENIERIKSELAIQKKMTEEMSKLEAAGFREFKELEAKYANKLNQELDLKEEKMRHDLNARIAARKHLKKLNQEKLGNLNHDTQATAVLDATEGEGGKKQGEGRKKQQIDEDDEAEVAEAEAVEKQKLEAKIANLRRNHEEQVNKLQEDILYKKNAGNVRLQTRIDHRRQQQMKDANSNNETIPPTSPSINKVQSIDAQNRAVISFAKFMNDIKCKHKETVHRLKSFLAYESTQYGKNAAHLSANVIIESIINGFKKQHVYEIRKLNSLGKPEALKDEDRHNCIAEAANQMMKRYDRDVKNLMESLYNERQRDIRTLQEKGASRSKIVDADQRRDIYDLDSIRKEQGKLLYSLAGLNIDINLLHSITINSSNNMQNRSQHVHNIRDDDEDDDDDDNNDHYNQNEIKWDHISTFQTELNDWKIFIIQIEDIYARSIPCLYSLLYATHTKLIHSPDGDKIAAISRNQLMSTFKFTLNILGKSFNRNLLKLNNYNVNYFQPNDNEFLINQLQDTLVEVKKNGELLLLFSKEENIPEFLKFEYSQSLETYFKSPSFSEKDVFDLYHILARPCTPEKTTSQQMSIEILKNLKMLMLRRKKEIQEILLKSIENADALKLELGNLESAYVSIQEQLTTSQIDVSKTNAECLMIALQRIAQGSMSIPTNQDLLHIEKSIQTATEQKEVRRIIDLQASSAEKLDISLKLQKLKEKQALQTKLLARRTQNTKGE